MISLIREDGKISRMVVFNAVAMTLSGIIPIFPELKEVIRPEYYPWALVGVSALNIFLRQVTTQPLK